MAISSLLLVLSVVTMLLALAAVVDVGALKLLSWFGGGDCLIFSVREMGL